MATKTVSVKVSADGLAEVLKLAERLNNTLDKAEKPRKIGRAASAALSASEPTVATGLTRGTAGSQTRGDSRDFSRQAQGLGGLVHLYATFAANIFAVSAAFNALSKAADFSNMEKAADILSTKVGMSIRGVAKDMKSLTDGAVSMADALSQSSLAASAGLTTKQIKELTTVAKGASLALGRDMTDALQRVFRGTIKIEPELLDELGLMVKVDDANKAYAKTLNKTVSTLTDYERRQAFVNAVTTQGISKYKELANQAANPFSKLLSSIQDLGTSILNTLNTALGPFVSLLSTSPTALLLGIGAIVSLLLKQAVPAISNMRKIWEEQDQVAQKALTTQIGLINDRKKAISAEKAEQLRSSQVDLVATTAALEGTLSDKLKGKKAFVSSMRALTWVGLDQSQINEALKQGNANIDKLVNELQTKITQKQNKINATKGLAGSIGKGYDSDIQLKNAEKYLEVLKDQHNAANTLARAQLAAQATAAGQAATAEAAVHSRDKELTALMKKETEYQNLAKNRGALAGAYSKGDTLGFMTGYRELHNSIDALKDNNSTLTNGWLRFKGTLGLVTVSMSKLLGTFSVWSAGIAIAMPILGYFAEKWGLTNEKLKNAETSSAKLNESLKLQQDIIDKTSRASNIQEMYTNMTASAQNLVDVLKDLKQSLNDLEKFNNQKGLSGTLDTAVESIKGQFFNSGIGGKDENQAVLDKFIQNIQNNKGFYEKYGKLIPKGEKVEDTLNYSSSTNRNLDTRMQYIIGMEKAILEAEQGSAEDASKVADSYKSLSQNLKEVDTLSSEYVISLTNQSKELKALSAYSTSAKDLYTQLKSSKDPAKNAAYFISSITSQFEQLSNVPLDGNLLKVKLALEGVQKRADAFYKQTTEGLGNSVQDNEKRKAAEENRQISISTGINAQFKQGSTFSSIEEFQVSLSSHSLKVAKSLADLATASTRASIEQAKLAKNLRSTQFFGGLFAGNAGIVKESEYDAEKRKAASEVKAERNNLGAIKVQQKSVSDMLEVAIKAGVEAITPNGLYPIQKQETGTTKDKALALLKDKTLYSKGSDIAGQLLSLLSQLENLGAAAEIAGGKIALINAGLTEQQQASLDKDLAKTSAKYATLESEAATSYNKAKAKQASDTAISSSLNSPVINSKIAFDRELLDLENQISANIRELAKAKETLDDIKFNPGLNQEINNRNIKEYSNKVTTAQAAVDTDIAAKASLKEKRKNELLEETITLNSTISSNISGQLSLLEEYNSLILRISENYTAVSTINNLSIEKLVEQNSLEKDILEIKQRQLRTTIALGGDAGNLAKQKYIELEQQFIDSKLKKAAKLTDMYKQQHELNLKTMEESGNWKELFTGNGLQEAATIMANRIEETMGKAKSSMSQLATGLVDAADSIVDSFTTMIQKMDETRVTWVAFRDMVRNTLSDMFRNMATDIFKNQIKKMMLGALGKFGLNTETDAQKASNKLGLNTDAMVTSLDSINKNIELLVRGSPVDSSYKSEGGTGNSAADIEARYNFEWLAAQAAQTAKPENNGAIPQTAEISTLGIVKNQNDLGLLAPSSNKGLPTNFSASSKPDLQIPTAMSTPFAGQMSGSTLGMSSTDSESLSASIRKLTELSTPDGKSLGSDTNRISEAVLKVAQANDSIALQMSNLTEFTNTLALSASDIKSRQEALLSPSTAELRSIPKLEMSTQLSTPESASQVAESANVTSAILNSISTTSTSLDMVETKYQTLVVTVDSVTGALGKLSANLLETDFGSIIPEKGKFSPVGIEPLNADYSLVPSAKDMKKSLAPLDKGSKTINESSFTFEKGADMFKNSVLSLAAGNSASSVGKNVFMGLVQYGLNYMIGGPAGAVASAGTNMLKKAKGGIVGPLGDLPLHKFAKGGIASSPQMALFGEGSKNEAFVPLPDNRSIPVTLKGGGATTVNGDTIVNVTVNNSGESKVSVETSKELGASLATRVKSVVQEELMKQLKHKGMLYAS